MEVTCCISMCSGSQQILNEEERHDDSIAIAKPKPDGSGRVAFGKYIPTEEEVIQHAQVRVKVCKILQISTCLRETAVS